MDDRTGAQWITAWMMDWADAVVRYVYDQTQDAEVAQEVARQVFLAVGQQDSGDPPAPAVLFHEADRWIWARGRPNPTPGWGMALARLAPDDRALAAAVGYAWRSFDDVAAASGVERSELFYALLRVQGAMGQHGMPPGSDREWLQWLHEFGPLKPTAATAFRWSAWNPAARPRRPPGRVRPRHVMGAAALVLAVIVGGYAIHLQALAGVPPLPFTPVAPKSAVHLLVAGGVTVSARPFGSTGTAAVPGSSVARGLKSYRIGTITAAQRSTAYQIGPLHVGFAVGGAGTALVLQKPSGPRPRVTDLAGRGQRVGAVVEPRGFLLYRFVGTAGAARVAWDGKVIVLAWSQSDGPASYVRVEGGVWSVAPAAPPLRGPLGSRVFGSAPRAGSVIGVLRDGVLWGSAKGWWLLRARGAALPLVRFLSHPSHGTSVTAPYPASSNEVVGRLPVSGAASQEIWWNLSEGRWGAATALTQPSVLALPTGWVQSLPAAFMTNQVPPAYVAIARNFLVLAAWGHDVFGGAIAPGGRLRNTGTYDWATRTLTPVRVLPTPSMRDAVDLPGWGPTWVEVVRAGAFPHGNSIPGPATIRLAAADGRYDATIALKGGQQLTVESSWIVVASSAGPPVAAWPDAAGQIRWQAVDPGAAVRVGNGFLFWTRAGHTYVWMPAFAWPKSS